MFASHRIKEVGGRSSEFRITVHCSCVDDDAFGTFVTSVRSEYVARTTPFVLVFDLRNMEFALPNHIVEWVHLFHSVKDVTRRHLIATHICISSPTIKAAIETFLKVYLPTKPLTIHTDWEALRRCVRDVKCGALQCHAGHVKLKGTNEVEVRGHQQ